jgi:hypothetical protein
MTTNAGAGPASEIVWHPTPGPTKNREGWLTALAGSLRPLFKGWDLGRLRVTCGWPSHGALARHRRVVGQCFGPESSRSGVSELFVSPLLEDPAEVAGTLAHEMAHVAAGVKAGHGRGFVTVCDHVGLTAGRPTSVMPGRVLADHIGRLVEPLGPYPHEAMRPALKEAAKGPTATRLACPGCGCVVTISFKWLAAAGPPTCGCGVPMEAA